MKVEANILIDRPIEDVFEFITDVRNMPRWVTGVSSAEMVSDEMHAGAHFVCRYTSALRPNEIELEVTTYERPHKLGLQIDRGPFNFEGLMSLSPADGGTAVVNSIVVDPDSLATRLASLLFGWFVRPSMRRRLARELEVLRRTIMGEELAEA